MPATGFADFPCRRGSGLYVQEAQLLTWPFADRDVVFGVDPAGHAARFDPSATPLAAVPFDALVVPATSRMRSLHAADLDGDGMRELVVAAAEVTDPGAMFVPPAVRRRRVQPECGGASCARRKRGRHGGTLGVGRDHRAHRRGTEGDRGGGPRARGG